MRTTDPEVSDVILDIDPQTMTRRPVSKQAAIAAFLASGNHSAARVVQRIPERDGALDPDYVDRLLVRVHTEMQWLAEEFQHGRRLRELIGPMLRVLRERRPPPYRVVDVGCGTGFAIRWLAARGDFGPDVELIGADFNPELIAEARRLASAENLPCRFVLADAFRLPEPGHIFVTTGVVHHFRGDALRSFFAQHEQPESQAFFHFDFQPGPLAPIGSRFWHWLRMRTALARHDGVLSAVRAYTASELTSAARAGTSNFLIGMYGQKIWSTPLPRVFHTLVGFRPELREPFLHALGVRAGRMGELR
ncbi:Methyltransferase type 11 [Candidatus Koribacter versatilis Ellin345]|uniref:Methyltransferase type 11 n=1 Tax=Koribacter versatilis (strain Ellin345) TaxID=204669 RepID=Q1IHB0_KORVE|nr:methyltransferase domain-containing protein [Candidatus Koribacter versatilis]ABF43740.1 Methyltransferase type 11 [Candidatus Koribacter versatilis Ellin345]